MKNLNQQMKSYIKSTERPKVDRQLRGETQVEFESKGNKMKIKKITPPQSIKKKEKKILKTYYV